MNEPELVARGFSSLVFRTPDGDCLRVARTAVAGARLCYGYAVAHAVAEAVPGIQVPRLLAWLPPSDLHPFGAAPSTWLDGTAVDGGTDPRSVGEFLRRLHSVSRSQWPAQIEQHERWWRRQLREARQGLAAAAPLLGPELAGRLAERIEDEGPGLGQLANPALIHGDFWPENAVQSDGWLTGVLDWEASAIGDPAADFAGLWYLGAAWATAVMTAAGASPDVRRRCSTGRILRELEGASWAAVHADRAELAEAAEKIALVASVV